MIMPHFAAVLTITSRHLAWLTAAMLGWTMLSNPACASETSAAAPGGTKEFFTEQPADTPLVIRLSAFETEIESRIFDPNNALLRASGVPVQRLGSLYQFIEAVDKPRQLRIEVTMGRSTARSKLDMQVISFDPNGPDKTALMKAYRLLSAGLELEVSRRADAWTMKVITLMQAANFFDLMGMLELQLWSEFYAHYFLLQVLNDPLTAAEGAREIYAGATRSGLNELALAAVQLEGSATARQVTNRDMPTANALSDQAQKLFQNAAELAARLDFQHENALAVYHSGLAFEVAGSNKDAFRQFETAVGLASACGDTALANQVRQHAAELHESLGDNAGAISLMQQISAEAPENKTAEEATPDEPDAPAGDKRADREMVAYLYEQGRLLEKTYRHKEAAEVLRQALELNQKSPGSAFAGPIGLLLAKSLYGAGQMDAALQYLQEAIKKTSAVGHEETLQEALGILAAIHRGRGDYPAMSSARERQGMFITAATEKAAYTFEKGLDELARNGTASADARTLLRQSAKEAREGGTKAVAELALLQLCALGESPPGGDSSCSSGAAQAALADLETTGLPVPRQQARLLWSQILHRDGQLTRSIDETDRLIEEMQFYQAHLPGVLGAWYWQNHELVFDFFMSLLLERTGPLDGGKEVEISTLAGMDRLMRYSRQPAETPDTSENAGLQRLRSLLAARETADSSQEAASLDREILPLLQQSQKSVAGAGNSGQDLGRRLSQLSSDEALLTYYFAASRVYAWVGRKDGLRLVDIPWSAKQSEDLSRDMEGLRWDSANGSPADFSGVMDRLGQKLLAPVERWLPQKIYFLSSGLMEGVPLEALRVNGRFLGAKHRVVNLLSMNALGAGDPRVEQDALKQFFLAGNRREGAGDFAQLRPSSAELEAIADIFVGPGLHMVQGAALQWDEFQDERFTGAGVVHLAMPGIIDLRKPEQSRFLLSDNTNDLEHEFLLPQDIESKTMSAALVVLSASEFTGSSQSAFDHDLRFITEFLHTGAGTVLASLWRVGDLQASQFMQRFYLNLRTNPDVAEALYTTKSSYLAGHEEPGSGAWAAFQLFVD